MDEYVGRGGERAVDVYMFNRAEAAASMRTMTPSVVVKVAVVVVEDGRKWWCSRMSVED